IAALDLRSAVPARPERRGDALEVSEVERRVGAVATLWLIEADVPRLVPEVAGANELKPVGAKAVDARAHAIDRVNHDDVIEKRGSLLEPVAWWRLRPNT